MRYCIGSQITVEYSKTFTICYLQTDRLLIQCGGYGNLQKAICTFDIIKDSTEFKEYFSKWKDQWYFAKPVDTEKILKEIGYRDINVYLEDYPVTFKDKKSYSIYLKTVVLGPYLKCLPSEKLQDNFLQRIIQIKEKEKHTRTNIDT